MMTMVDKYLATEMFGFNALSQFNIALFIYHGGSFPDGLVIYAKAKAFKAKANATAEHSQGQEIWP